MAKVTWHADSTFSELESLRKHGPTAGASSMHEVVDCIPDSGNDNSYDTTSNDIEKANNALETDL